MRMIFAAFVLLLLGLCGCDNYISCDYTGIGSKMIVVPGELRFSDMTYEITPTNAFVRFDFVRKEE